MKKAWASAGLTLLAVSGYASNLTIDSFIAVQGPNQATAWTDRTNKGNALRIRGTR